MGSLLEQLRSKLGSKFEGALVSYWCPKMECYVYIGRMNPIEEITLEERKLADASLPQDQEQQVNTEDDNES